MKILHVLNNFDIGGAEKLLANLLPELKKNCEVDVLVLNKGTGKLYHEFINTGVKLIINDEVLNLYSFKHILKIRTILSNYDVIHVHLFPSMYWTTLASILFRINVPIIMTEHSTFNKRRKYRFLKFVEKVIYNKFSKIICISQNVENELIKWLPSVKNKTVVIYNGINLNKFITAKPFNLEIQLGVKPSDKLILMVGRFTPAKNHSVLIKALSCLPEDYKLILVGDGENKEKIIRLSTDLGINNRVYILDSDTDIPRILKSVDLFVMSSNWEGFGIAAVEAMASGLPVLGSNVIGLSEVIDNPDLLFDNENYMDLANKIMELINNEEKRNMFKKYSVARSKLFDIKEIAKKYYDVYLSIEKKR